MQLANEKRDRTVARYSERQTQTAVVTWQSSPTSRRQWTHVLGHGILIALDRLEVQGLVLRGHDLEEVLVHAVRVCDAAHGSDEWGFDAWRGCQCEGGMDGGE